jgi:hypothetical protein
MGLGQLLQLFEFVAIHGLNIMGPTNDYSICHDEGISPGGVRKNSITCLVSLDCSGNIYAVAVAINIILERAYSQLNEVRWSTWVISVIVLRQKVFTWGPELACLDIN